MKRLRGKRITLLLASVIPLLAVDDVPMWQSTRDSDEEHPADQENELSCREQTQIDRGTKQFREPLHRPNGDRDSALLRQSLNPDILFEGSEFGQHYNIVVPFRMGYPHKLVGPYVENRYRPPENDTSLTSISTRLRMDVVRDKFVSKDEKSAAEIGVVERSRETIKNEKVSAYIDDSRAGEDLPGPETMHASSGDSKGDKFSEEDGLKRVLVDYASKSAGALILEKSSSWNGISNVLNGDKDKYAIIPCEEPQKSVVIGLSEDILVKQIVLSNYERYSSHIGTFQVMGSPQTMGNWVDLGTYTSPPGNGKHAFDLHEPSWARYLKFRFVSHYGDEHYCTVSQISVHGSTMLQGFHEQWAETVEEQPNDKNERDVDVSGSKIDPTFSATDQENGNDGSVQGTVSTIGQCYTRLDAVCQMDYSFERSAFLFASGRSSTPDFDLLSALSSASFCQLGRQSARTNYSHFVELGRRALAISPKRGRSTKSKFVADLSDQALFHSLTESVVVKHIQSLISRTTGIDIHVERFGVLATVDRTPDRISVDDSNPPATVSSASGVIAGTKLVTSEVEVIERITDEIESQPLLQAIQQMEEKIPFDTAFHASGFSWSKILEQLPSAACLEKLDFADFRSGKKLNLRNGGPGSHGNAQGGGGMEPIFKKLTDEIKALQTSVSIHDQFSKALASCYQQVFLELLVEMDVKRSDIDKRIFQLERKMQSGLFFFSAVSQWMSPIIGGVVTISKLPISLSFQNRTIIDFMIGTLCMISFISILFISIQRKYTGFLRKRTRKGLERDTSCSKEIVSPKCPQLLDHWDKTVNTGAHSKKSIVTPPTSREGSPTGERKVHPYAPQVTQLGDVFPLKTT